MELSVNAVMRLGLLKLSTHPGTAAWMRRYGMRLGAARFVAGETLDECIATLRRLTGLGFETNTTLLGEGVRDAATAAAITNEYLGVLDRLAAESLPTRLSVKPTHLGLAVAEDITYGNVVRLVERAAAHGQFVRMDMEESAHIDATLRIYRRLRAAGYSNVGIVLQSYLRRTERDLDELLPLQPNLRLVKGAYLEPPDVAFPRKADVDRNLTSMISRSLREGGYTAIATHDDRIIDQVLAFVRQHQIPRDRYELQMLYGVRPQLQRDLLARGERVMVATPFGADWYPYFMRRLAERPANVLFFVRNLLRR
ncbi:MAG TPA: proline dehydrogenase family protein [bacterium]|nr:proline dehydrogenase family protein [bacterium]